MKKVIILCIIMGLVNSGFSQGSNPASGLTKQDYLQKSKKKARISQFVGIPGSVMFAVGSILYFSEILDYSSTNPYNEKKVNAGETLMITGGVTVLVGAGFAIASRINKKRAMNLSLSKQFVPQYHQSIIFFLPVPSLTINISL